MRTILIIFLVIAAIATGVFFVWYSRSRVILNPPTGGEGSGVLDSSPPRANQNDREHTLLFVGDLMFDRNVAEQIQEAQDPLYPFLRIAEVIKAADLAIANLEGPISTGGVNQGSKYSFRFEPVGTINALQYASFDIVSLANNHIWDWGKQAFLDTISNLENAKIGYMGAGRNELEANVPVIAQVGDAQVAFLGYTTLYPKSFEASVDTPGISSFDTTRVADFIKRIKAGTESAHTDIIIVSLHWGEEYQANANEDQQKIAHALIDAGADLIIGHHPHVVQEVEKYSSFAKGGGAKGDGGFTVEKSLTASGPLPLENGEGYIAYSLGNFVFDQDFSVETMAGLMLRAYVKDKKIERIEQIPVQLTPTFQPYLSTDE